MCEQTSIQYAHGDIVWCKLGPCWWPGEVHGLNELPQEVLSGLKKKPIAAVRFFQEEKYEYVRNLDHIYNYNCRRKNEFIKKGLDMHRANIKHMDKFPLDVATAERLTKGDPDIITSDEFAPEKKINYSGLFGSPKRGLGTPKSTRGRKPISPKSVTPLQHKSNATVSMASFGSGDFKCHICGFRATRVNVVILHSKSHRGNYAQLFKVSSSSSKRGRKKGLASVTHKMAPSKTSSIDEDLELLRRGIDLSAYSGSAQNEDSDSSPERGNTSKRKSSKNTMNESKAAKKLKSTEGIRKNILADWEDDDYDSDADIIKETNLESSTPKPEQGNSVAVDKSINEDKLGKKSCFDFEDEEETATILHQSPGRKIPRVIPENQKTVGCELDFEGSVLEEKKNETENIIDHSTEINKDEASVSKDVKTSIEEQNIGESTSFIEKENSADLENIEKENSVDLEKQFNDIMEQTAVSDVPVSMPGLLKCEQNFHEGKGIKFPDKFETDSTGDTSVNTLEDKVTTNTVYKDGCSTNDTTNDNQRKLDALDDSTENKKIFVDKFKISKLKEQIKNKLDKKPDIAKSVEKSVEITKDEINPITAETSEPDITKIIGTRKSGVFEFSMDTVIDQKSSENGSDDSTNKSHFESKSTDISLDSKDGTDMLSSDIRSNADDVPSSNSKRVIDILPFSPKGNTDTKCNTDVLPFDSKDDIDSLFSESKDKTVEMPSDSKSDVTDIQDNTDALPIISREERSFPLADSKDSESSTPLIFEHKNELSFDSKITENLILTDPKDNESSQPSISDDDKNFTENKDKILSSADKDDTCNFSLEFKDDENLLKFDSKDRTDTLPTDEDILHLALKDDEETLLPSDLKNNENVSVSNSNINESITFDFDSDSTMLLDSKNNQDKLKINLISKKMSENSEIIETKNLKNRKSSLFDDSNLVCSEFNKTESVEDSKTCETGPFTNLNILESTLLAPKKTSGMLMPTSNTTPNKSTDVSNIASHSNIASQVDDNRSDFDSIENEISRITSSEFGPKIDSFSDVMFPKKDDSKSLNKQKFDSENTASQKSTAELYLDNSTVTEEPIRTQSKLLEILTDSKNSNESSKSAVEKFSPQKTTERLVTPESSILDSSKFTSQKNQSKKFVIGGKTYNQKTAKFLIKSATSSQSSDSKRLKPVILSEQIIKPATEVSVQKVSPKRSFEDIEDIDTFIIQKPNKKLATEGEIGSENIIVTVKGSKSSSGPTIASKQSKPIEVKESIDDTMFDINSMPIVLSDEILTPESIENMPIVISNVPINEDNSASRPEASAESIKPVKQNKPDPVPKQKTQIIKTVVPNKNQKVYQASTTKLLKSPTVITQPGKPGKFIILPSSSVQSTTTSKYTVGKRPAALKSVSQITSPVTTSVSNKPSQQTTGNKIMLVTNAHGHQSRILLSPAQHKMMLNSKMTGTKIIARNQALGLKKGTLLSPNNIVTSKGEIIVSGTSGIITQASKTQALSPQAMITSRGQIISPAQTYITSKGQVLTPVKALKTCVQQQAGKKIQIHSQKILIPATSLTKSGKYQTVNPATTLVKTPQQPQKQIFKKIQPNIGQIGAKQTQLLKQTSLQNLTPGKKFTLAQKSVTQTQQIMAAKAKSDKVVLQKIEKPAISAIQSLQPRKGINRPPPKSYLTATKQNTGVNMPPLVPLSPTKTADISSSITDQPTMAINESSVRNTVCSPSIQQAPLMNQLIIQDAMGNQTSVSEGQILAVSGGESVDGQPSYVLVTVDETGKLYPLDNQALLALDPNLIGTDGNVTLQLTPSVSPQSTKPSEACGIGLTTGEYQHSLLEQEQNYVTLPTASEQQLVTTEVEQQLIAEKQDQSKVQLPAATVGTQNVTYSIANPESGQQIIISGDPENAQQILNALASGNQDLSKLISGAEGNLIINTSGQQLLLNTDSISENQQIVLTSPAETFNLPESYGNDLVTQVTSNQDILAAALANTDVFQQDSTITDTLTASAMSANSSQLSPSSTLYQNMQLPNITAGNVSETSTTLGPPIMTPLEVPPSKKIRPVNSDTSCQVRKSLELPITITDPNISQTVAQQSLLPVDLQTSLDLPITITDPNISNVKTSNMNISSPSYGYSLPTLDDATDDVTTPITTSMLTTGPISMPLLNEDPDLISNSEETDKCIELESSIQQPEIELESKSSLSTKESTALDVLANVTTTSALIKTSLDFSTDSNNDLENIFSEHNKKDVPSDLFSHSTDTFVTKNTLESEINKKEISTSDDFLNKCQEELTINPTNENNEINDFVLESPGSTDIDGNSDEISMQPPIGSEDMMDMSLDSTDEMSNKQFTSGSYSDLENGEHENKT